MSDPNDAPLSPIFLDFCDKVRKSDPSILPEAGQPFNTDALSEKEVIELADALLENTNVTYLSLQAYYYTESSAEAMAKYVRTSKHLQRICLQTIRWRQPQREEMKRYFLAAIQESTSLKEVVMKLPPIGGPSNHLAFENMLTHTQSLRHLILYSSHSITDIFDVAAARSGLKNNTTLQELTLQFPIPPVATIRNLSSILTSLCDHPHLRKLCLCMHVRDLTGLDTLLLSDNSKITELDIHNWRGGLAQFRALSPVIGLPRVLEALVRRPTLTQLGLRGVNLRRDEVRLLQRALCNTPSLHSLALTRNALGSAGLAELVPALYHNTSIKVLDMSGNGLDNMESAEMLRDILRRNKTMTALNLCENEFGRMTGAVECIAEGLGSNSTLLKIDLLSCRLGDDGVSTLVRTLSSRNTTLQKLDLQCNSITSTGVGFLLGAMEQNSYHITDLDLRDNQTMRNEGASLLATSLENNTLPNLKRLSLSSCGIGDDGLAALVSALEQNTSLLHLDLRDNDNDGDDDDDDGDDGFFLSERGFSERAFLALAESLPEMKVLQRIDFSWCNGLASAMPLLLTGLRENKSLFCFHVTGCAPFSFPPDTEETARFAGGWMQEMERLGYRNRCLSLRNRCLSLILAQPRGIWPHALAWVATFPDVIFEVLRSNTILVPSND
jgi:hypothetical protein